MKRLNPLYIIALFVTIVFVSFYLLANEKKEYSSKVTEFNKIQIKAKEFKDYKSNWNNEKFVNKTLDQILRSRTFSNQKVLRVKNRDRIKVKLQSSNPKILNSFLNKVLNKKLIIKKLEIDKNYINLEIGLK